MDHKNICHHDDCKAGNANISVCQTISEMDWERGLWYAAFYGDKERVGFLIDKARNAKEAVNSPDNAGYTPLHYAARKGNLDICKILLQNGANIDSVTKSGKATALHKAAAAGKTETVKFLIHSGADVEIQDVDGKTILHKAVEQKHFELVNFLVHAYPQLQTIKDNKNICPVHPKSD